MCVKSILFLILKYLPFQFNYIKKLLCWDKIKISLLSIHQCFRVVDCGWPPFLPRQHCTKMKCSLRIPSVNVTKSAGICRFGHIYTGIFNGKLHFFVWFEILMPWKAKKEYVQAKYQKADQRIYERKWKFIVIFWILGRKCLKVM